MNKVKEFFMRWFNWFFCIKGKDKQSSTNTNKEKSDLQIKPVITDECHTENNDIETKKDTSPKEEKPKKKRVSKENKTINKKEIPEGEDFRVEVAERRKRLKKKNETK